MKKKAVMLVLAAVAIVSLVVVGYAVKPMARAQEGEGQSEPIGTIGEITTELRTMNKNFGRLIEVMGEEEVIEWTGQVSIGPGNPLYASIQKMCGSILDASGGRLKLEFVKSPDVQVALDELHEGEIDFVLMNPAMWGNIFPAAGLFTLRPGGMSPMEKYLWFISGGGAELVQQMIDDYDYNVHLVPGGGQLWTPEIFLHSNVEITEPADLVDLKIRAAGDGMQIFNMMGANATWMPGGEVYVALDEGWIDAAEYSSPCLGWNEGLYKVADYVYLSECRGPHEFSMFLVNKSRWEELPDDLKVMVEKISREAAIAVYADMCQADIEALEWFEASENCTVENLPKEVEREFLNVANQYYNEKALENEFYAEVLQSLRDFEASFREYWERP